MKFGSRPPFALAGTHRDDRQCAAVDLDQHVVDGTGRTGQCAHRLYPQARLRSHRARCCAFRTLRTNKQHRLSHISYSAAVFAYQVQRVLLWRPRTRSLSHHKRHGICHTLLDGTAQDSDRITLTMSLLPKLAAHPHRLPLIISLSLPLLALRPSSRPPDVHWRRRWPLICPPRPRLPCSG